MTRATKYAALDVHQATTLASVRTETGQVIARTMLPTEPRALTEFFRGMRGTVHVAFEELLPILEADEPCERLLIAPSTPLAEPCEHRTSNLRYLTPCA